jgi:hypothetical protein
MNEFKTYLRSALIKGNSGNFFINAKTHYIDIIKTCGGFLTSPLKLTTAKYYIMETQLQLSGSVICGSSPYAELYAMVTPKTENRRKFTPK